MLLLMLLITLRLRLRHALISAASPYYAFRHAATLTPAYFFSVSDISFRFTTAL